LGVKISVFSRSGESAKDNQFPLENSDALTVKLTVLGYPP
jgi:hypothetical protein